MVTRALAPPAAHRARILTPWYGGSGRASLHRYLSDDFVPQFLHDLAEGSLDDPDAKAWLEEDRFGEGGSLVLRQPVHRAFYLVSAEVCCDVPGRPPLDPKKIASAGMVIRRDAPGAADEAWTLLRGVAIGWEPALSGVDPDVARRAARVRGLPFRDDGRPYSGELTHPMHSTTAVDAQGRRRTIVWGFVPVGSGSRPLSLPAAARSRLSRVGKDGKRKNGSSNPTSAAAAELEKAKAQMRALMEQALARPFGARAGTTARADGVHVKGGVPTRAFAELVDSLVRIHQVGSDPAQPQNARLESRVDRWRFDVFEGAGRSLLDWLRAVRKEASDERRLGAWLDTNLPLSIGLAAESYLAARLPDAGGHQLDERLVVSDDEAQQLRAELVESHGARVSEAIDDLPVPRFGQRDDDLYVAIPFVRVREEGCEHVHFGPPTVPFRVAAPLDPQAARPVHIPLPRLSDLKKALPKASFLAPDDLAEKLLGLPMGKGLTPDLAPMAANSFGLCWMFSFSLPAITLCAVICLMIVLSLLDLVFRWMPFIFLRLPMFCLGIKKP